MFVPGGTPAFGVPDFTVGGATVVFCDEVVTGVVTGAEVGGAVVVKAAEIKQAKGILNKIFHEYLLLLWIAVVQWIVSRTPTWTIRVRFPSDVFEAHHW